MDGLMSDAVPSRPAVKSGITADLVTGAKVAIKALQQVPDEVKAPSRTMDRDGWHSLREVAPGQSLWQIAERMSVKCHPSEAKISELMIVEVSEPFDHIY